jgi:hypothetical protein
MDCGRAQSGSLADFCQAGAAWLRRGYLSKNCNRALDASRSFGRAGPGRLGHHFLPLNDIFYDIFLG